MKPIPTRHSPSYRSSAPCHYVSPRPHRDPSLRFMAHGPLQPMDEPSWLQRIFGRK